jgi:hypothetical protein
MKSLGTTAVVSFVSATILPVGCANRPEEPVHTSAFALDPPSAADASDVSDIEAFIAEDSYSDAHIQHSFHTTFGEQIRQNLCGGWG